MYLDKPTPQPRESCLMMPYREEPKHKPALLDGGEGQKCRYFLLFADQEHITVWVLFQSHLSLSHQSRKTQEEQQQGFISPSPSELHTAGC
jgi:hypothetical protein